MTSVTLHVCCWSEVNKQFNYRLTQQQTFLVSVPTTDSQAELAPPARRLSCGGRVRKMFTPYYIIQLSDSVHITLPILSGITNNKDRPVRLIAADY